MEHLLEWEYFLNEGNKHLEETVIDNKNHFETFWPDAVGLALETLKNKKYNVNKIKDGFISTLYDKFEDLTNITIKELSIKIVLELKNHLK